MIYDKVDFVENFSLIKKSIKKIALFYQNISKHLTKHWYMVSP